MQRIDTLIVGAFTIFLGLAAGFFFAFTNPTMMGFAHTSPETYVEAMREINRAVRNVWFLLVFAGTLVLGALAVWRSRLHWPVVAAFVAYLAAVVLTQMVNVPMNDAMEVWTAETTPPAPEIEAFRMRWMAFNTYRMWLSSAGFAVLVLFAMPRRSEIVR